ncbi:MAG: hypothetical protein KBA66_14540 [Leptospiraceae bacterium]|nr:hypothetical protein [Leptospiraceae bacterium]
MDKEIVLDNEYVTMWFHQDKKIVHHKYHQFLKGDYIRNQLNGGVDLLIKHKAKKWLSDNRNVGPHTADDTEWINTIWLPNAIKAGWKFWALVQPESVIAQMNLRTITKTFADMGVTVQVFSDPDIALKWLESV